MKAVKILGLIALIGIASLAAFLVWEHTSDFTLPAPTGSYAVGRSILDWRDAQRELLVFIWYPARPNSGAPDDYIPPFLRSPSKGLFGALTKAGHIGRDGALATDTYGFGGYGISIRSPRLDPGDRDRRRSGLLVGSAG